jgi:hypothetical protein
MKAINSSLCALKDCVRALRRRQRRIPYRRSKLTMLLKDCFEPVEATTKASTTRTETAAEVARAAVTPAAAGRRATVVLAHVAPPSLCAQYTRSTMDYASQLLAAAAAAAVASSSLASPHGGAGCPPDRWSKSQLQRWLVTVSLKRLLDESPWL